MRGTSLFSELLFAGGALAAEFLAAEDATNKIPSRYIVKLDTSNYYPTSVEDRLGDIFRKYDEGYEAAADEDEDKRIFPELQSAELVVTNPATLKELLNERDVALVEEVQVYATTTTLDRERRQGSVAPSWGMDRVNQKYLPLDGHYRKESGMEASRSVTVYMVDTGVDHTHPEFEGRVEASWSYFTTTDDGMGHGTHVAGIITSKTYGLSRARVKSVKVLGNDGTGSTTSVLAGINYVAGNYDRQSPTILSLSLGGGYSQAMTDAINILSNVGVTVVAASGNLDSNACLFSPGSAESAITVGATTSDDKRSWFSNYGPCLDLFAPGSDIESTKPNGLTGQMSGTSQAVPHVTAAVANYLGLKPFALPAQIKDAILNNATNGVVLDVNLDTPNRMLYMADVVPNPVTQGTTTCSPTTQTYTSSTTHIPEIPSLPAFSPSPPVPTYPVPSQTSTSAAVLPPLPSEYQWRTCDCVSLHYVLASDEWCRKNDGCNRYKDYCYCVY